jgi:hypothetical protein
MEEKHTEQVVIEADLPSTPVLYTPSKIDWKPVEINPEDEYDIGGIWTPERHLFFPRKVQEQIKVLFIMALKDPKTSQPRYPQTYFSSLPRPILEVVASFIAGRQVWNSWPNPNECIRIPKHFNKIVIRFGLGCTTMSAGSLSCGFDFGFYFCFHPAYYQGALRCPGSNGNTNMGWSPDQNKFHKWEIVYTKPNKISVRVEDADDPKLVFNFEANHELPPGDLWKCSVGGCDQARGNNLRITFW